MRNQIETRAAIRTKFVGPTNTRGSRISVCDYKYSDTPARRIFVSWDYSLDINENHAVAAEQWVSKFLNIGEPLIKTILDRKALVFDGYYYWAWNFKEQTV